MVVITGKSAETKWKNLVDTFWARDKSGTAGETIEQKSAWWHFYEKMSFIKPYLQQRKLLQVFLMVVNGIFLFV